MTKYIYKSKKALRHNNFFALLRAVMTLQKRETIMILALCVDDQNGLRFNRRRQSRDKEVIRDLLASAQTVRIHPDSKSLFDGQSVHVGEDYLALAEEGELCFCEDDGYLPYADKIEQILLYRWNRVYPRDLCFEFPGQWRLAETRNFPGSSHEKISREVYIR